MSTGYRNTMMSPRLGSVYGKNNRLIGPDGAYASLSTSMWSPTITVVSIDGVGTMNACTSVVVPNSRIRIFSDHSLMKLLTDSAVLLMKLLQRVPVNQQERALPPGLTEKILTQIRQVPQADRRI